MKSSDATSYLQRNRLTKRLFWSDLVRIGEFLYIPTNVIREELVQTFEDGEQKFREMECHVTQMIPEVTSICDQLAEFDETEELHREGMKWEMEQ